MATVTTTVANPHTLRFYLHGNDVPTTVTPSLGLGPLTVTIPLTTPVTLSGQRLKLTISSEVNLIVSLQSGSNAFVEATSFAGTP